MQVSYDEMDEPGAAEEVDSYGAWGATLMQWCLATPCVTDAITSDGHQVARYTDDEPSTDPLVWVGREVDPFDRSTFDPVRRSTLTLTEVAPVEHPRLIDWYSSIYPGFG